MNRLLYFIYWLISLFKKKKATTFYFYNNKNQLIMGDLRILIDKGSFTGTVVPRDAAGNAAEVQEGSSVYQSSNPAVFTVDGTDETFRATLVGVGEADLTVSADADLGDGVTTISGVKHIVVLPSQAKSLDVEIDGGDEQTADEQTAE